MKKGAILEKPVISIIIPAWNEGKYIEKTIESVKHQNFKDYEIVVVCNGCTDNTESIAKRYARVISLKNGNVAAARNAGAKKAKGKKLVFLDADTALLDKEILREISSEKAVIGTCFGKPSKFGLFYFANSYVKNLASFFFGMVNGITFCDKKLFFDVGGYDAKKVPMENHDLIKKMKKHGNFKLLPLYVSNSVRRYEKWGLILPSFFWIKKIFGSKEKYPAVR